MSIVPKVRAVEKLFASLSKDVQKLQEITGITCPENCIKCCTTTNIVATSLEFYPLAYHLFKCGDANKVLNKIDQIDNPNICSILNTLSINGDRIGCSYYEYRGLICRLFSNSYSTDKHGIRKLSTCKTLKENNSEQIEQTNKVLVEKTIGPKISNYYSRLQFIDFTNSQKFYPIGEAIRIAIETVISDFNYRGKKAV